MDVIALHAAGVRCAVACLGTALSEQQIELAAGPISWAAGDTAMRQVVLCLDGDAAVRPPTPQTHGGHPAACAHLICCATPCVT